MNVAPYRIWRQTDLPQGSAPQDHCSAALHCKTKQILLVERKWSSIEFSPSSLQTSPENMRSKSESDVHLISKAFLTIIQVVETTRKGQQPEVRLSPYSEKALFICPPPALPPLSHFSHTRASLGKFSLPAAYSIGSHGNRAKQEEESVFHWDASFLPETDPVQHKAFLSPITIQVLINPSAWLLSMGL